MDVFKRTLAWFTGKPIPAPAPPAIIAEPFTTVEQTTTHLEQCGTCPVCIEMERMALLLSMDGDRAVRMEALRRNRLAGAYARGMAALNQRGRDMTDTDRLILARSITMMLAKNLG